MTARADFVEEVQHEVSAILRDLGSQPTAREIVHSVYRNVEPKCVHTEPEAKEQLVALIETTRDLCVAHLLAAARHELSTRQPDPRAVCLLLRFFEPQIRAAVRRHIRCVNDLEPVVNDVRFRIWRSLPTFEGGRGQLHYYVRKACESACTDLARRTVNGEQLADPSHLIGPCGDDNQQHIIVELEVFLRRSLPLLRPKERLAVEAFLRYDGDWASAQQALGIPRQTMAGWFKAALRHLRRLWDFDD